MSSDTPGMANASIEGTEKRPAILGSVEAQLQTLKVSKLQVNDSLAALPLLVAAENDRLN